MPYHDVLPPAHSHTRMHTIFRVPDEYFADRADHSKDYLIDVIVPIEPLSRLPLDKYRTSQAHLVDSMTSFINVFTILLLLNSKLYMTTCVCAHICTHTRMYFYTFLAVIRMFFALHCIVGDAKWLIHI